MTGVSAAGGDRVAGDRVARDRVAGDRAGGDRAGDRGAGVRVGRDQAGGDRAGDRGAGVRGRQRFASPALRSALAPVSGAMLSRAREQAGEIVGRARREAEETVALAHAEAQERVAQGREAGRVQAAPLAAAEVARGRRDARSILLRVQREAHEELRARIRAGVAALRDEPGYGALLEKLSVLAGREAGPGATVAEDAAGGAVARGRGVVVDCSLPTLADAAVDALGAEVAWLWTPGRPGRPGAPARPAGPPGGRP